MGLYGATCAAANNVAAAGAAVGVVATVPQSWTSPQATANCKLRCTPPVPRRSWCVTASAADIDATAAIF
jgi:hypothetical protein